MRHWQKKPLKYIKKLDYGPESRGFESCLNSRWKSQSWFIQKNNKGNKKNVKRSTKQPQHVWQRIAFKMVLTDTALSLWMGRGPWGVGVDTIDFDAEKNVSKSIYRLSAKLWYKNFRAVEIYNLYSFAAYTCIEGEKVVLLQSGKTSILLP